MPNTALSDSLEPTSSAPGDGLSTNEPVIRCAIEFLSCLHSAAKPVTNLANTAPSKYTSPLLTDTQAPTLTRSLSKSSAMQLLHYLSVAGLVEQFLQGSCQDSLCLTELRDYMDSLQTQTQPQI